MSQDTIAAIATPKGSGGIGIVRLSGQDAIPILLKIFFPTRKKNSLSVSGIDPFPSPRYMHHGYIVEEHKGIVYDEALVCVMPGPHSYTGENVVEIQCHGGVTVMESILKLVIRKGARIAGPGEFTMRAFINGRIDLTQAEAVADIINAKSEKAAQMAMQQLSGGLKKIINEHLAQLRNELASIQAIIEFPEDIQENYPIENLKEILRHKLIPAAQKISDGFSKRKLYQHGIIVNIVGKPNVGKSSLLNRLIDDDKAIVTEIPGTTRDIVEEQVLLSGLQFKFVDTAGIHETKNPIEKIGIEKTHSAIEKADIVLFVLDGSGKFEAADDIIYKKIKNKNVIIVLNKCDLNTEKKHPFSDKKTKNNYLWVSALTGEGIKELEDKIVSCCTKNHDEPSMQPIIPNARQHELINAYLDCLEQCEKSIEERLTEELISEDLISAVHTLQRIIGQRVDSDVLDQIFNQFCIGK